MGFVVVALATITARFFSCRFLEKRPYPCLYAILVVLGDVQTKVWTPNSYSFRRPN